MKRSKTTSSSGSTYGTTIAAIVKENNIKSIGTSIYLSNYLSNYLSI
jgi:hypothetical protein